MERRRAHRWKTNLRWLHRRSIEKRKARGIILYREGCAQSFSRFLILDQQWRTRGRSTLRTRKVGLDPKMYAFSPYPPIPIELQVLPRYSPRFSYAYETSATKLSYWSRIVARKACPREPRTLIFLDGITNA